MSKMDEIDVGELASLARRTNVLLVAPGVTEGPWILPLEEEPRAVASARSPDTSILGLDRDGMAVFWSAGDAALVVHARAALPLLAEGVLAMAEEIRALRASAARGGPR